MTPAAPTGVVADRRDRPGGRAADAGRGVAGRGRRLHRPVHATSATSTAGGWWCATGRHQPRQVLTAAGRGRGDRAAGERQARRRGRRASGGGSPRRSCRRGAARPRRSPRCCRCCTCTACPAGDFVPGAGAVPRHRGRPVRAGDHPADRALEGRAAQAFAGRDLSGVDYVYVWADGIHVNVRLEEHKLCLLVLIGVRADGRKELIALADGYRESAESWADLLRDCPPPRDARPGAGGRGRRAGVLGRRCARCSRQPGSSAAGSTRSRTCWRAAEVGAPGGEEGPRRDLERRGPRARPRPRSRRSRPPTGRSSPRPSRRSPTMRRSCSRSTTSRPSTGSTCAPPTRSSRPSPRSGTGTKVTKGPGSKAAGIAMAFKLIQAAQERWRVVNAPHLVALVRAGATFENGKLVERPDDHHQPEAA